MFVPKCYCVQAFALVNDLMIEHQEIFWSLFSVDMDDALAAQPPDTWDSFQLFQLLNQYLSSDRKFFKINYLFIIHFISILSIYSILPL